LKKLGYKVNLEVDTGFIREDILAEKAEKMEQLMVEVKGLASVIGDELARYEDALYAYNPIYRTKVILVLPVIDGENFEVWGIKQLKGE